MLGGSARQRGGFSGVARRVAGAASAGVLVACAQIVGLTDYRAADGGGAVPDAQSEPPVDAPAVEGDAQGGAEAASGDDAAPEAAVEAGPRSYVCSRGGCNTANHACQAAGTCYCTTDNDCPTACVVVPGGNDTSCGAGCTGAGASDGFGCQVPACNPSAFGYAPSNFDPSAFTPPSGATTDCNATYDSTSHTFTSGSCAGAAPVIRSSLSQTSGGHAVDILFFQSLTIAMNSTLRLVGSNPVILAVYGPAAIHGTIDASASGKTPGAGGDACPSASNGGSTAGYWELGAGGAGQAAAGGSGGASKGSPPGAAGAAQGSGPTPLAGGCQGGAPYSMNLGFSPAQGAGGGAFQVSALGAIDLSGATLRANGSKGGDGEAGSCTGGSQNGTGGAGGGSGGAILLEGSTIQNANEGTLQVTGGSGGTGGAAPAPNSQVGGAGGAGGAAASGGSPGGPGTQNGSKCGGGWGGDWSGGGGGGGAGGYVSMQSRGGSCLCHKDTDCSTGACANAASQCTGTCTGSTAAGAYDALDCQIVTTIAE